MKKKNSKKKGNPRNTVIGILAAVLGVALIASVSVLVILSQRTIPNPDGTVGNTAGNLNNDGRFCEYDGKVYFYNPFPGGGLFSMNLDESDLRRINTLETRNILAGGKYLYYFHTGRSTASSAFGNALGLKAFVRCKLNGSNPKNITTEVVLTGQLVDNTLYLLTSKNTGSSFSKIGIDGSGQVTLANYAINPASVENGVLYYNGTRGEHYIYALDTASDVQSEVWKGNAWYPIAEGDYIYYLDVAENYRLCRYSRSQKVVEVLTNDRVDCFNVGSGFIYYQKNSSSPQLKCMRVDGSSQKTIAEGNYTHINMTSRYVYFQEYGNDTTLYHSQLGSDYYELFRAAAEAVQ